MRSPAATLSGAASLAPSGTDSRAHSGFLAAIAGPLVVATIVHAALIGSVLAGFGFNPTGPIFIGNVWDGGRFWNESTYLHRGFGYDGQFFYYIAHDPLLWADGPLTFLDHPAYRYGRVLYPLLVWVAALGRPEALAWSMLAVNLAMALAGTAAAVAILRTLGASRWLALAYAFSPGVTFGLMANLSEPTAFALIAAGVALFLHRRHHSAGWALALAALAREVSMLVSIGFALHAAARRSWREVGAYLAPLTLPIAWHLWVWARIGALPALQGPSNFGPPFSGALYRVRMLLGLEPPLMGLPVPEDPLPDLLLVAVSVAIILHGLSVLLRRRDVFALQLWIQAAAGLCTTAFVWIGVGSYARVLGLLYLFFGLALLTARSLRSR